MCRSSGDGEAGTIELDLTDVWEGEGSDDQESGGQVTVDDDQQLHAKRFWALSPYLPRSTEGRVGERCELTENRATSCLTAHGASV
jgi:hypothetical protein